MHLLGRKSKKMAPLFLAFVVSLMTFALAVPAIQLNAQKLGEGSTTIQSPAGKGAVNFVLDTSNPDNLIGVTVSFNETIEAGSTIYVKLYNGGTLVDSASKVLASDLSANSGTEIDFSSPVPISNFDRVAVVVKGPEVQP